MVSIGGFTEEQPGNTDGGQSKQEDNKKANPGGVNSRRNQKRRKNQTEMINDVYIQIRILRGVLDYCQQNKLYPHDHPDSLLDFLKNWLQHSFVAGDFREMIGNLQSKFQSEKPEASTKKTEESLDNVDDDVRILAGIIDYYISKRRYPPLLPEQVYFKDVYKKWLFSELSFSRCCLKLHRLKRKYENQVGKNGQDFVFLKIEDLVVFKLSEIVWGSECELSEIEVDMKILAAMIDYYITKWRYPFEEIEYMEDFYSTWIRMIVPLTGFLGKIERLKEDYKKKVENRGTELIFSGVDDFLMFKLSEVIWGSDEPSRQVDVDAKILESMVDYYSSTWKYPFEKTKYLKDFHRNYLNLKLTLSQCLATIHRLARKYKDHVKNGGKDSGFSSVDGLKLLKLSEVLWGGDGSSSSSNFPENPAEEENPCNLLRPMMVEHPVPEPVFPLALQPFRVYIEDEDGDYGDNVSSMVTK